MTGYPITKDTNSWWWSSEKDEDKIWVWSLRNGSGEVKINEYGKSSGFFVRCKNKRTAKQVDRSAD